MQKICNNFSFGSSSPIAAHTLLHSYVCILSAMAKSLGGVPGVTYVLTCTQNWILRRKIAKFCKNTKISIGLFRPRQATNRHAEVQNLHSKLRGTFWVHSRRILSTSNFGQQKCNNAVHQQFTANLFGKNEFAWPSGILKAAGTTVNLVSGGETCRVVIKDFALHLITGAKSR